MTDLVRKSRLKTPKQPALLTSLDNVTLPAGLQSLTFGQSFNQSMENVMLPAGLQVLDFGHYFDHSLESVTLPSGVTREE